MSDKVQALLDEGVSRGIFPMAAAAVIHRGELVLRLGAGGATERTWFDLASLTKIICTTALFMNAWGRGKVGPNSAVSRWEMESPVAQAGATLADLLYHRSGLPASVPYFARAMPAVPELFAEDCPAKVREEVRVEVVRAAFRSGLRRPLRKEAVYSDVGFIQLGELLARAEDAPLDVLFRDRVAAPLELEVSFRRLSSATPEGSFPVTGTTRPRESSPGEEGKWEPFPLHPSPPGEVDDDNAWVMDGVAGHAGLFGSAVAVAQFGLRLLEELQGKNALAKASLWEIALEKDATTPGSSRAMGFDTPSAPSSIGQFLGNLAPGAVGHLGFTGTSLWIDRPRSLSVALLTNRTTHGRGDIRIREFRPRFHDAVAERLGLQGSP